MLRKLIMNNLYKSHIYYIFWSQALKIQTALVSQLTVQVLCFRFSKIIQE